MVINYRQQNKVLVYRYIDGEFRHYKEINTEGQSVYNIQVTDNGDAFYFSVWYGTSEPTFFLQEI